MAVRSKRLWGPTAVGVADTVLYTCPAGKTALLKTLSLVNNAAVATSAILRINSATNGGAVVEAFVDRDQGTMLAGLFIVLEPGDTFHGQSGLASVIFTGYGAELNGVAP